MMACSVRVYPGTVRGCIRKSRSLSTQGASGGKWCWQWSAYIESVSQINHVRFALPVGPQ